MYSGIDGFLGTRASLALDFVAVAMIAILAALGFSVWLVRYRRSYHWHKRLQLGLAIVLAAAVTLFEMDMRLHGWQERARPSPYFGTSQQPGAVFTALYVHLAFSVSTTFVWIYVIVQALRKFPRMPVPNEHSPTHRPWGWIAALDLLGTTVTGWIFYYLAFVA
jgi:uncharacterized membrane protein YozB (DUF420 family)